MHLEHLRKDRETEKDWRSWREPAQTEPKALSLEADGNDLSWVDWPLTYAAARTRTRPYQDDQFPKSKSQHIWLDCKL